MVRDGSRVSAAYSFWRESGDVGFRCWVFVVSPTDFLPLLAAPWVRKNWKTSRLSPVFPRSHRMTVGSAVPIVVGPFLVDPNLRVNDDFLLPAFAVLGVHLGQRCHEVLDFAG